MRTWQLHLGDPLSLILAADARLAELNYANDQIWELTLGRGEPAAIVLQTTYGLRARSMRIFPQFTESHQTVANPAEFDSPVTITQFAPNYLKLLCAPFDGIEAELEYWVPSGQVIAGRIRIKNSSDLDRNIRLELAALLNPASEDGKPMTPRRKEAVQVLVGQSGGLAPVLFITGGAEGVSSPYSALIHELDLEPGAQRRFTWVLASLPDDDESFRLARLTAAQSWDGEVTRIEMINSQQVEITTGNPDWDAVLAMGQKAALGLLFDPTAKLANTSFVSARLPDHGYSQQGSGADYSHLWSGQTALEAWYLVHNLLPGNPNEAKEILRNFLYLQQENGFIDFKPGLGGQRSGLLATPILTSLAWRIYQFTEDIAFLREVFQPLLRFVQAWFSEEHDADGDGIPEWSNPIQSGYDENPVFSRWLPWGQGVDIRLIESPDLCAFLYREITMLLSIAQLLDHQEPMIALQALADNLNRAVQSSWNYRIASYQYWDRDTHQTSKGETLATRNGAGEILLDLVFELPTRLLLRMESPETQQPQVEISVHGHLPSGQHRVDTFPPDKLLWYDGVCTLTLPELYAELEHIHIRGLPPDGTASLQIVDLSVENHTLLAPIWAGIPTEKDLGFLLERRLQKDTFYGQPFGIPAWPKAPNKALEDIYGRVWLPWNVMVGEGLLGYGRRAEAAELVTKLMDGVAQSTKREQGFYTHFHANTARGSGQRNHLFGLPPIGLFLDVLGIRPVSPWKVEVLARNPFPWPVRVAYRGLVVTSGEDGIRVRFPDGENIDVEGPFPCVVENTTRAITEGKQ